MLRLLLMSDRDKDVDILASRHQITVPQRQLGKQNHGFTRAIGRSWRPCCHRLPLDVLHRLRLLVRVSDPGPRWEVPCPVRRRPDGHGHRRRPQRRPDAPQKNSIMERWVQTCRRELLDHTLIWNQQHLLHARREFELFYHGAPSAAGHRERTPVVPVARAGPRLRQDRPPRHRRGAMRASGRRHRSGGGVPPDRLTHHAAGREGVRDGADRWRSGLGRPADRAPESRGHDPDSRADTLSNPATSTMQ